MTKITGPELKALIDDHGEWLIDNKKGRKLRLINYDLRKFDLSEMNLGWSEIINCYFGGSDLKGIDLSWSKIIGCDLSNCDLRWSNLGWSEIINCDLSCSDFSGSSIKGSDFTGVINAHTTVGLNILRMDTVEFREKQVSQEREIAELKAENERLTKVVLTTRFQLWRGGM